MANNLFKSFTAEQLELALASALAELTGAPCEVVVQALDFSPRATDPVRGCAVAFTARAVSPPPTDFKQLGTG